MTNRQIQRYTLVELLLTVAVMAILASLLISVMGVAIEKQKKLQCKDNMKNIGVAMMGYIDDTNGYMVNSVVVEGQSKKYNRSWDDYLGIGRYDGRNLKMNGTERKPSWSKTCKEYVDDPDFSSLYLCPTREGNPSSLLRKSYRLTLSTTNLMESRGKSFNCHRGVSAKFEQTLEEFTAGKREQCDRMVKMRDPSNNIVLVESTTYNHLGKTEHATVTPLQHRDNLTDEGEVNHEEPMRFFALLGDFSVKNIHFQDTYDDDDPDLMSSCNDVRGTMWGAFY